jgi:hypothetical protein
MSVGRQAAGFVRHHDVTATHLELVLVLVHPVRELRAPTHLGGPRSQGTSDRGEREAGWGLRGGLRRARRTLGSK